MSASVQESRTDVLGRRIVAALIDLLVLVVLFIVLATLIGDTEASDGSASANLDGGPALLFFALSLLYYGVLEATTGQTLGKRLLGIRVARLDGSAPSAGHIAARTVLRVVDGILFYLVGLIAVLATGQKRQRIGDLAAGTTVVSAR
jgi:uncharacterized RDD family membrane protein YckC